MAKIMQTADQFDESPHALAKRQVRYRLARANEKLRTCRECRETELFPAARGVMKLCLIIGSGFDDDEIEYDHTCDKWKGAK
jgi:hypothetical protein